jgi:nucleotide-binding universal stress UspA family protein
MEKHILIAIDNSRPSIDVVNYASQLNTAIPPITFTLLHVQPAISTYLTEDAQRKPSARRALEKIAAENEKKSEELLKEAAQRLISKGVRESAIHQMTLPRGKGVADDLLSYASTKMVGAILVGRRGTSYLKQWFVGSVTANLVEHSKVIPIWVVDGQVQSNDILLSVDGSQSALRALDHLSFMLSGQPDSAIQLIHVRPILQDYCEIKLDEDNTKAAQSIIWDDDQNCMDDFHSQAITVLKKNGFDISKMKLETLEGNLSVTRAIIGYARENDFGTIVMGRRGKGQSSFFGSVSRGLFQRVENMSLWIVP